jgi:DNA-binding transcriptional MerR regulator
MGIPVYIQGHHVALMRKEVAAVRAVGRMTASEVARALGIGASTLVRLERRLGLVVPRMGKHKLRSYAPEQVEALRAAVTPASTEAGFSVFYMYDIAERAGCTPHKIGRRRGVDLPAGRWVTHPRQGWVFTAEEVEQAVAQIKRWPRLSRRRRCLSTSPSSTRRT